MPNRKKCLHCEIKKCIYTYSQTHLAPLSDASVLEGLAAVVAELFMAMEDDNDKLLNYFNHKVFDTIIEMGTRAEMIKAGMVT